MNEFVLLEDMQGNLEDYTDYCRYNQADKINKCPICGIDMLPKVYGEIITRKYKIILLLECPSCNEVFVLKYDKKREKDINGYVDEKYIVEDIFPKSPTTKKFDEEIEKISEKFIITYNQSQIAETYKLDQIAGMGYRKSIEYLIKDYIIYNNPEKEEEVKKMMLGPCINTMVENPKIQKMAKGATWLGNDATHYVQKWEDKDIEDLKRLIDLTVYWIMYEIKTKEYEEIMKL
ncbi:hypothetical protein [Clostridium neonatale]|uniref:hypothetical protein n=1 Tax=Clostridium neonatale TaxID=137838 RepID=UPI00291C2C9C|nr:hypothetical protein [Clostridium neonatale]CAI3561150.1 conserved hypothetical protein [Clostridium neonatale]CAI3572964.1 conserved hypothetical protein [Clostridium neonatale]